MDSVLAQTFSDWEYVIVDDGSTDASAAIALGYADRDPRIKVVQRPNGGVAAARNTGVRAATPGCDYVLWFDGDDVLEPTMLELLVSYLDAHPRAGAVLCNRQHIDESGVRVKAGWRPVRLVPGPLSMPRRLAETMPLTPFAALFVQDGVTNPSSTLVRRHVFDQTPGWDETLGPFEDWDLIFRIALLSEFHYLPDTLIRYRIGHPGQATAHSDKGRLKFLELYRRWSCYQGVPEHQVALVREAIRFREGRVLPLQWLAWGTDRLIHGQFVAAARSYAVALKAVALYTLRSITRRYDQPPLHI